MFEGFHRADLGRTGARSDRHSHRYPPEGDLASRPDLAERCQFLELTGIVDDETKSFPRLDLSPDCRIERPFNRHLQSRGCFEPGKESKDGGPNRNGAEK